MPYATVSLNLDRNLLSAAFPLLERGEVEAVEWSFDALFGLEALPPWFADLLMAYAESGRLVGHGIYYSVCSAEWSEDKTRWLDQLTAWNQRFPLAHVSEHFGFLTGRDFHRGAPVSPPFTDATRRVATDRLQRLSRAYGGPVGLENLALAYSTTEVKRQGEFLEEILRPVNGFILLDAHNIYCQAHNFEHDPRTLCAAYPLERVREIHISGGSWQAHATAPGGRVRRDTHDEGVPEAVFDLLRWLLDRCPNLAFVTLEQLPSALATEEQREQFRRDYLRMRQLLRNKAPAPGDEKEGFLPPATLQLAEQPRREPELSRQQRSFSTLLEESPTVGELDRRLARWPHRREWRVDEWAPHMRETVWRIARKWR